MFVCVWTWIQWTDLDTVKMNATRKIQRRVVLRYLRLNVAKYLLFPSVSEYNKAICFTKLNI